MMTQEKSARVQENFVRLCLLHKERNDLIADVIELALKHLEPPRSPLDAEQTRKRMVNTTRAIDALRKLAVQIRES